MHRKQFKPKRSDTRRHTVVMKIYTCHRVHRITQEGIWNEQVYNFNILAKLARMFLLYRGNYTKVTWSWETIHTCSGIRFFLTSTFRTSWLFKAFFRGGRLPWQKTVRKNLPLMFFKPPNIFRTSSVPLGGSNNRTDVTTNIQERRIQISNELSKNSFIILIVTYLASYFDNTSQNIPSKTLPALYSLLSLNNLLKTMPCIKQMGHQLKMPWM